MPKASVKRLIECQKKDLINLVLDIEKYPQFVPFCYDAKIYENKNEGDFKKINIAGHQLFSSSTSDVIKVVKLFE